MGRNEGRVYASRVQGGANGDGGKVTRPPERLVRPFQRTERLMTLVEVSDLLGVPVATLYGWRHRGEGPSGYRIGRHVRYRRAAVEAWIETQADHRPGW